ncbi:MAG: YkgJ family cysteine cluster protein [Phycisphaerales bacterium]|nr:YkgJ family cysteine cluster protein [Phycisphaerales bacterium]
MTAKTHQNEWYADGLPFQCMECGGCCTGAPGFVWFTAEEGRAMAEALDMTEAAFHRMFAHMFGKRWSLKERKTQHGLDCVLLDRETVPGKAVCRVYAARPAQCRTWPFWPENLRSPETWRQAAKQCPGINQGNVVPIEQIRIQRDATPE